MRHPDKEIYREYALTSGELGAVAAQTVMVALLPVLLERYARSAFWIGFAIGGEGVFAILLPFWAGALSDRLPPRLAQRFGRRMFFVLLATPLIAGATAVTPFLSGYWPLAVAAFVSFAGLHSYLTPFWSLLIDGVPDERRSRVQGIRGVFRSIGLGYGLVAAGLLFALWRPLPFLLAAALVVGTTALTWLAERASRRDPEQRRPVRLRDALKNVAKKPAALWLLAADALWNAAVDGIRPYFFIYARRVLGVTVWQTSIGLLVLVAALGGGSYLSGRLGERHGPIRVLEIGSALMSLALFAGFFARNIPVALSVLLVAGLGAAAVMALPYPLFASIVGEQATGKNTGIYVVSVTAGRVAAPMLVGGAVDLGSRWLPQLHGYPFMWFVSGGFAALGWLALRRAAAQARDLGGPARQGAALRTDAVGSSRGGRRAPARGRSS